MSGGAINKFQSKMESAKGFARLARYQVHINPPARFAAAMKDLGFNLNDYAGGLSMMCDSITMPGKDLQTATMKHGQELARQYVESHVYEGTITASFYLESNLQAKSFFEVWQNLAVANGSNNVNYYEDYVGSMEIYQLGAEQVMTTLKNPFDGDNLTGEGIFGAEEYYMEGPRNSHRSQTTRTNTREEYQAKTIQTYGIEVSEVYPATVGQIEYAYSSVNEVARIPVEFQYKSWRTMDPSSGIFK